jgi:hypothetical protein
MPEIVHTLLKTNTLMNPQNQVASCQLFYYQHLKTPRGSGKLFRKGDKLFSDGLFRKVEGGGGACLSINC